MRVRCVGGIVRDGTGRLLLIKRGTPPHPGHWSVPGGRVEPGESDAEALVRELKEETGLDVSPGPLIGTVERPGPGGVTFEIHDYAAFPAGSTDSGFPEFSREPEAGDDAADARWFAPEELHSFPIVPGLLEALTRWGAIV